MFLRDLKYFTTWDCIIINKNSEILHQKFLHISLGKGEGLHGWSLWSVAIFETPLICFAKSDFDH